MFGSSALSRLASLLASAPRKSTAIRRQDSARQSSLNVECLEERVLLSRRCVRDDFPNLFTNAAPLSLAADGSATQNGSINCRHDTDIFEFVAPVSGKMTVDYKAGPGSRLRAGLFLSDEKWNYISGQYVSSTRSAIEITSGTTYFAGVFGFGKRTGAYRLSFHTDATSVDGSSTLALTGTDGDDVVTLGAGGTGLKYLVINGVSHDLESEYGHDAFVGFTQIQMNLLGGDDQITIDPSISLPAVIDGGDGDDTITGGSGNDTLRGGPGADALIGGAGNDALDGGLDSDSASVVAGGNALLGGDGNDSILGGGNDDSLDGGSGNDSLTGGAGDDFLDGGPGTNELAAISGSDTWVIEGQPGDNNISVVSAAKTATVAMHGSIVERDTFSDLTSAVNLLLLGGSGGDNQIQVSGPNDAVIIGGTGNNTLQAGAGMSILIGGSGTNRLNGGTGTNYLVGGPGNDTLLGGAGTNIFIGSTGADVYQRGSGDNSYSFQGLTDWTSTLATVPNVSFTVPYSLSGSVEGFAFQVQGTATVTATLNSDDELSGTFSATGSGIARGSGWTVRFAGHASGSVSGPLSGVVVSAQWSGSGTASDDAGNSYDGSLSGGWSGVIPLTTGTITQNVTVTNGDGAFSGATGTFSGSSPLAGFKTTTNPFPEPPSPTPDQLARHLDFALMADAAYGNPCALSYLEQDGWTLNRVSGKPFRDDPLSGFHAELFVNANQQAVLAFRGTRGIDPRDWATNIDNFQDSLTVAYDEAVEAANAAKQLYPNGLTIVGHSLGGGEAQYAGLMTSTPTVAFNGAGLSLRQLSQLLANGLLTPRNTSLITHVDNKNDPLTHWLKSVGFELGNRQLVDSGDWGLAAHRIGTLVHVLSEGRIEC
jgi:Ca2+-binding RTX toxin-like protein